MVGQARSPVNEAAPSCDRAPPRPAPVGPPARWLGLQRSAGNRAVVALLQREAETETTEEPPVTLLRRGARGPAVVEVQELLNTVGAGLDVDGAFGPASDAAVRFFQRSHRLVDDGIVGRETRAMLDRESSLHGDPGDALAREGGPCHTPAAPGPDDLASTDPVAAGQGVPSSLLGFGPAGGGGPVGQPKPQQPSDLVVMLSEGPDVRNLAEASAAGKSTPIVVRSRSQLKDLLKARGKVGRLIIVSHGTPQGQVFFDGEPGGFVKLEDLANELKGSADVREVQFRGCNVGNDAKGLDKVKDALGSTSAEGTNCSLEVAHAGPAKINGVDIDTEAKFQKLNAKQKTEYDQSLRRSAHGHGDCIVELSPGQKLSSLSADQLRAFAMRHGGKLIMQYAKEDNTCWNDMQFGGSARCRRIQAK